VGRLSTLLPQEGRRSTLLPQVDRLSTMPPQVGSLFTPPPQAATPGGQAFHRAPLGGQAFILPPQVGRARAFHPAAARWIGCPSCHPWLAGFFPRWQVCSLDICCVYGIWSHICIYFCPLLYFLPDWLLTSGKFTDSDSFPIDKFPFPKWQQQTTHRVLAIKVVGSSLMCSRWFHLCASAHFWKCSVAVFCSFFINVMSTLLYWYSSAQHLCS
jgi:hypothetical protein